MTDGLDPILEQWLALFRAPLVGLIASWGADWATAEELAQDTFAEAWLARERLRGDPADHRTVGPWLRGIAHHLHLARRRQDQRRRLQPLPDELPSPMPEPDERLDVLRAAFAQLRDEHQTILRMFYLDETTTREVAALLDRTPKAIESQLFAARRALRAHTLRLQSAEQGASR
jgi:RNA polymerase sigma-70 factor, ECF subfamily